MSDFVTSSQSLSNILDKFKTIKRCFSLIPLVSEFLTISLSYFLMSSEFFADNFLIAFSVGLDLYQNHE